MKTQDKEVGIADKFVFPIKEGMEVFNVHHLPRPLLISIESVKGFVH